MCVVGGGEHPKARESCSLNSLAVSRGGSNLGQGLSPAAVGNHWGASLYRQVTLLLQLQDIPGNGLVIRMATCGCEGAGAPCQPGAGHRPTWRASHTGPVLTSAASHPWGGCRQQSGRMGGEEGEEEGER